MCAASAATAPNKPTSPSGRLAADSSARILPFRHYSSEREWHTYLKTTLDLRLYAAEGPGGEKRDALQWLLFISGHTARHTKQLQEVK